MSSVCRNARTITSGVSKGRVLFCQDTLYVGQRIHVATAFGHLAGATSSRTQRLWDTGRGSTVFLRKGGRAFPATSQANLALSPPDKPMRNLTVDDSALAYGYQRAAKRYRGLRTQQAPPRQKPKIQSNRLSNRNCVHFL